MPKFRLAASVLLFALSMIGCSKGTGSVTPRLIRLASTPPATAPTPTPVTTYPAPTTTPIDGTTEVNVDSYKVPIRSIELISTKGEYAEIYRCDKDTNDDCLLNLSGTAGADLLVARAVQVDEGTYDQMIVRTCMEEGSYNFTLEAFASIGTNTYLTKSGTYPSTSGSIEATTLSARQCSYTFDLASSVVVQPDSSTMLGIYYDLRNLVWMALSSAASTPPTPEAWSSVGCTGNASGSYDTSHPVFVCASFPQFFAYVGDAPAQERYLVNNRAVVGVLFEPTDYAASIKTPIGGYLRRYYGTESPAGAEFGFGVALRSVSRKTNGDFSLAAYGATSTSSSYFQTSDFPGDLNVTDNTSDTGTFTGALSGSTVNDYTVMRLE